MINSVGIYGFQSHIETVLELSIGINAIVGESDEGKSAIVRAMRWALLNEPRGSAFINWGLGNTDVCEVAIEFSEGEWISRQKTNGGMNQYEISTTDDPLKAIRSSLPSEVFAITAISDINMQRQQSWFLLDEKPGEVAKRFNELAELDIMDKALKIANARIRSTSKKITFIREENSRLEGKIETLDEWFRPAQKAFTLLDAINTDLQKHIAKFGFLSKTVNEIQTVEDKISHLKPVTQAKKELEKLRLAQKAINEKRSKQKKLRRLTESVGTVRSQLDAYSAIHKTRTDIDKLLLKREKIDELIREEDTLIATLKEHTDLQADIEATEDMLDKARKAFKLRLKKLGVCPTCGAKT